MHVALVAGRSTPTSRRLAAVAGSGWFEATAAGALEVLGPGDVAVGRFDVLASLDGVDDGLWALGELAARGVRVLNRPASLLATHDKLITARVLRRAGLPHPRTRVVLPDGRVPEIGGHVVVKPRFGSWGRGVARCHGRAELAAHLEAISHEPWFATGGALVQDLVPPVGRDLRVLVAGGSVVGSISRIAPHGEWRTNVALGAARVPCRAPEPACRLAVAAARAAGADFVGVDLLPDGAGWSIIELNGAVEFTSEYGIDEDPFAAAAVGLVRAALGCPDSLSGSSAARAGACGAKTANPVRAAGV